MKVAKSKLFIDEEYLTLHLRLRELKAKIRKGLREEGLYFLNACFGEDRSHGSGCGGEDISYDIKIDGKKFIVDFNLDGDKLEISERIELYTQNKEFWDSVVAPEIDKALVKFIAKKLVA